MTESSDRKPRRHHWLCVAYAFPPINRSGTHRTLAFVRHLDALGWDATVLTAAPGDEPVDAALLEAVPTSTTVIQVPWVDRIARLKRLLGISEAKAGGESAAERSAASKSATSFDAPGRSLRDWMSRLLITPDSRTGWIAPARRTGRDVVALRRPDAVYSTSPCMSAHLIAADLARKAGAPWVADFRDPWRENPFRNLRYATLDSLDAWLERRVLRRADHIICNTPTMMRALVERCPDVAGKCGTILNAFDPERLENVVPFREASEDAFVLTHCGQFYGPRSPLPLLKAVRVATERSSELSRRLRLVLVGSESYEGRSLRDWAADAGVERFVDVLGPHPHTESLARMAGSDAVVLVGSTGPGSDLQVPGKLFEYLALRRPIVATCPTGSPIAGILHEARAHAVVVEPNDLDALADAIVRVADGSHAAPLDAWSGVDRFARARRASELADIFDRLSGEARLRPELGTGKERGHRKPPTAPLAVQP